MRYWLCALVLTCAPGVPVTAAIAAAEAPPAAVPKSAATAAALPARPRPSGLEQRVRLLTAELGLDAQQQTQVRALLQQQREQVMKVWNDTSVPAGSRVSATRAIGDRTADRIRALLREDQKAKYLAPRKPPESQPSDARPSVQDWIKAASPQ